MKNKQKGFTTLVIFSVIALLIAGGETYLYFNNKTNSSVSKSAIVQALMISTSSIIINNSGSTNTASFGLVVNPDGSGVMNIGDSHTASSSVKQISVGVLDYQTLQNKILVVPTLQFTNIVCAKSVSFGYTENVVYNGETSGDITCPPSQQSYQDLLQIVNTVIIQAKS